MVKHFLNINDYSPDVIRQIIQDGLRLKAERSSGHGNPLAGKKLAMIFEKPSNRTRVSFEVGMTELGGHTLNIKANEIGMGVREPIRDVSQVLSRYVDMVLIRAHDHADIEEFAKWSDVPVINGLSDLYHPCQAVADGITLMEHFSSQKNIAVTYIGDGNNVCSSLIAISNVLGFHIRVCSPSGYMPADDPSLYEYVVDPIEAVKGADAVYTDAWTSMGQEKEANQRRKAFKGYQVDDALMAHTKDSTIFMHCMPVHYGEETIESVAFGSKSAMIDQAENRLHAQKAILMFLGAA